MNDMLQRALAAHQPDSAQLQEAMQLLKTKLSPDEKQQQLELLARQAPEHEQEHFADLFESLALGLS
jgi:hypothetical protein